MRKLRNAFLFVAVLACRCATMSHGTSQRIPLASEPEHVTATIDCHNGPKVIVTTPAEPQISRRARSCEIGFSQPGYQNQIVILSRELLPWTIATPSAMTGSVAAWDLLYYTSNPFASGSAFVNPAWGIAGGAVWFAVDFSTGAIYRHVPERVTVTLKRADVTE